jgi:hypothetical protein
MISVFVWKKSSQSEMGHASMLVRAGDAQRKFYVSWYPTDEVGLAFAFGVEKCVKGKAYASQSDEIKKEWGGARPDLAVVLHGLNEDKIEQAWKRLLEEGQWCLAGKNCATVVYHLLRAGGAPPESQMKQDADIYEKEHDQELPWSEEDHLQSKLAQETKNAWTPIRLFNYANAVSQLVSKE